MQVTQTFFDAAKLLLPVRHIDERGFFVETYNRRVLAGLGIDRAFVQDNHSLSRSAGVVRGLHFQLPPFAQAKLVRVVRGSILDVVVDIRRGSPTFAKHASARLSAENGLQIFVPAGFAHGFCTLEPDSEVLYKVDAFYSQPHERGVLWNDPALGIAWPVTSADAEVSAKDRRLPLLCELTDMFEFAACGADDGSPGSGTGP